MISTISKLGVLEYADGRRTPITLAAGVAVVGRMAGCRIRLYDKNVAEKHAQFIIEESGAVFVEGLDAQLPTMKNDVPVAARDPVYEGDRIQIGPTTFVFRAGSLTPPAPAQAKAAPAAPKPPPPKPAPAVKPPPANVVVGTPQATPADFRTVQMDASEIERLMGAPPPGTAPAVFAKAPAPAQPVAPAPAQAKAPAPAPAPLQAPMPSAAGGQRTLEMNAREASRLVAGERVAAHHARQATLEMNSEEVERQLVSEHLVTTNEAAPLPPAPTGTSKSIPLPEMADPEAPRRVRSPARSELEVATTMQFDSPPTAPQKPSARAQMGVAPGGITPRQAIERQQTVMGQARPIMSPATPAEPPPEAPTVVSLPPDMDATPLPVPRPMGPPTQPQPLVSMTPAHPETARLPEVPARSEARPRTMMDEAATAPRATGPSRATVAPMSAPVIALGPAPVPYTPPKKGPFGSFSRAFAFIAQMFSLSLANRQLLTPIVYNLAITTPISMGIAALMFFVRSSTQAWLVVGIGTGLLYFVDYACNSLTASLMFDFVTTGRADGQQARARVARAAGGILMFAAVSAVLDVASTYARERRDPVARILLQVLRGIWTTATYVIMPALVIEGVPLGAALKRSKGLMAEDPTGVGAGVVAMSLTSYLAALVIFPTAWFAFRLGAIHIHPFAGALLFFLLVNLYWSVSGWMKIAYATCFYLWARECELRRSQDTSLAPLPLRTALDAG